MDLECEESSLKGQGLLSSFMHSLFSMLKSREYDVLCMYMEGATYKEIAEIIGVSEARANVIVHTSNHKMRGTVFSMMGIDVRNHVHDVQPNPEIQRINQGYYYYCKQEIARTKWIQEQMKRNAKE